MAVSNLETVVSKCSSHVKCTLARFDLVICFGRRGDDRRGEYKNARKSERAIHFAIVLLSISSITFPTASFTFRTSSTLVSFPIGNETSFWITVSQWYKS